MKTYIVRRTVLESYEVTAKNRKDALDEVSKLGDPYSVMVIRETVKPKKP